MTDDTGLLEACRKAISYIRKATFPERKTLLRSLRRAYIREVRERKLRACIKGIFKDYRREYER